MEEEKVTEQAIAEEEIEETAEPKKKKKKFGTRTKKFFADFKKFITKGNVIDLAVAVVIGAAFNKIVASLVADIIMPLITAATGSATLAELSVTVGKSELMWGNLVQNIIDFFIIGLTLFIIIRVFTRAKELSEMASKKLDELVNKDDEPEEEAVEEAVPEEVKPEPVDETVVLLTEIRDLLKASKAE